MGPRHLNDMTVLVQKDQRIETLELQIQAYAAFTSHIQGRLLAALDAIDDLTSNHTRELASEAQTNAKLVRKLSRYKERLNTAEIERDDLRDAVVQLVEKVEACNDYSLWPYSRIRLSSLQDPLQSDRIARYSLKACDDEQHVYASALIASLRKERDIERTAHQQTRDEAECRITALQAQLACREAQLEAYVDYLKVPEPGPDHSTTDRKPTIRDEILKILDTTTTRNKELEAEIKILIERLYHARRRVEPHPSETRYVSTSDFERRTTNLHSDHQHGDDKTVLRPIEPVTHPEIRPLPLTPTPTLQSPSRKGQGPLLVNLGRSRDSMHTPDDSLCANLHHNLPTAIQDLDQQISELAARIDAFRTERVTLVEMLVRQAQSEPEPSAHPSQPPPKPNTNFVPPPLAPTDPRQSAEDHGGIATSVHSRSEAEQELLNEIERLQELLHRHESEVPQDSLLEDYDGEMSMELATPLSPTTFLPPRTPSPETHGTEENLDDDPPFIPLPPSPVPVSVMLPPPNETPPPRDTDNLRRVERELEAAQRQLEVGENAVHELRDALADLNLHLPIRTQDADEVSVEEDVTVLIRPSSSLR